EGADWLPRCRRASYSSTAAATLTFSDSTRPSCGIETSRSHDLRTSGRSPFPSAPKTNASPPARSASHIDVRDSPVAPTTQRPACSLISWRYREVRHDGDRQMLHRAGGRPADGRRHARGTVRRHDDPGRPRSLGAAADRPEVPRVADLIEAGEERALPGS